MGGYDSEKVKKNLEIAKEGFKSKILRRPTPEPPRREPQVEVDVKIKE